MSKIRGAGKDTPLTTDGPPQSHVDARYDLLHPFAMQAMATIAGRGAAKYGANTWQAIGPESHLNHSMMHILAFLAGDTSEEDGDPVEHLHHALWRLSATVDQYDSGRHQHRHGSPLSPEQNLTAKAIILADHLSNEYEMVRKSNQSSVSTSDLCTDIVTIMKED